MLIPPRLKTSTRERGKKRGNGLYCEPVNLLSNVIFLIAALIGFTFAQSNIDYLLSFMVLVIGICSSATHLQPSKLSMLFDEISIASFCITYVVIFAFFMSGLHIYYASTYIFIFLGLGYICLGTKYKDLLDGSMDFVPVLFALYTAGIYCGVVFGVWSMMASALLATLAFVARAADYKVRLDVGTHFLWHIFAGTLCLNLLLTKIIHFPS